LFPGRETIAAFLFFTQARPARIGTVSVLAAENFCRRRFMFSGLDVVDVRHGRGWTALTSFVLQGILVSAAVILPLLNPSHLPEAKPRIFVPISFGERVVATPHTNSHPGAPVRPEALVVRTNFSFHPSRPTEGPTSDTTPPNLPPGILPEGRPTGVLNSISGTSVEPVLRPPEPAKPPRQSVVMESNLLNRVQPQYPAIARQIRLQGDVIIRAVISRAGAIEQATVVSGSPLLASAALDAVKQWRYRPYSLNGEPVEVETQITVKFILNQ
jgi:protein TonB